MDAYLAYLACSTIGKRYVGCSLLYLIYKSIVLFIVDTSLSISLGFSKLWQQKVKETNNAKYFRVHTSENTSKCDIVDTNLHASCTPGTIQINNTAFLLCRSGLNK
jgi:hypothetical protein